MVYFKPLMSLVSARFALSQNSMFSSVRHMSMLGNLKPSANSTKTYKRVGRGPSSGRGKTATRGQKGQKARSSVKPWFEGGQTPIYKLFPKIGFTNTNAAPLEELNISKIQQFHDAGRLALNENEILDMKTMKDIGLVTGSIKHGVKILGGNAMDYKVPLKIEASKASASAIAAIEKAGGEFTARYFSKFGLRAHLNPEWFLENRGRVPLQARPTRRKDIQYYSDESKRGYLVKENDPLLQKIQNAKNSTNSNSSSRLNRVKKGPLQLQLDAIAEQPETFVNSINSKIITLEEMKQNSV